MNEASAEIHALGAESSPRWRIVAGFAKQAGVEIAFSPGRFRSDLFGGKTIVLDHG